MNPESIINNKYRLIEKIGRGSYSQVWKVEDLETNNIYALKILLADYIKEGKIEIDILERLKYEKNIVRIHNHTILKLGDKTHICILMDLYEKDLFHYQCSSNEVKMEILKQIISGVKSIHDNNIIHADLKPGNILIREIEGKLDVAICDFSLSHTFNNVKKWRILQTPYYRSPEIVFGGLYDKNIDLWSLGCIIYELFTGKILFNIGDYLPHKGQNIPIVFKKFNEEMVLIYMFEAILGKMDYTHFKYSVFFDYYIILRENKYQLIFTIDYTVKESLDDITDGKIKEIVKGLLVYESTDRIDLLHCLSQIEKIMTIQ